MESHEHSTTPPTTGGTTLVCVNCGGPFHFSEAQRQRCAERGWPEPRRCFACRQWMRTPRAERGPRPGAEWRTCADCGQSFSVSGGLLRACHDNGWPEPRACRRCRIVGELEAVQARAFLTGATDMAEDIAAALTDGRWGVLNAALDVAVAWQAEADR